MYIRHTEGTTYNHVQQLMRLRTGAHHLAIETGRWSRPSIPREERLCPRCTSGVVEDEVHLLCVCVCDYKSGSPGPRMEPQSTTDVLQRALYQ